MKKSVLKRPDFKDGEILTRSQLKKVLGARQEENWKIANNVRLFTPLIRGVDFKIAFMKYLLIIILILAFKNLKSQDSHSIMFETQLTWDQIRDKAQKENKSIFIDIYTTWCAPCKQMESEVFTDKMVADFFNSHFINLSIQMDSTKNDSSDIVKWRNQSQRFAEAYSINSYPTYIFLNPQGYFVHAIYGSSTADEFVKKAKMALDPATQLAVLKRKFTIESKDTTFLLTLINTAEQSFDQDSISLYMNQYLANTTNWRTKRNLEFIAKGTRSSSDVGFNFLSVNRDLVDSVLGKSKSLQILRIIAYDEVVFPLTRKNARKQTYGSGMMVYSGEIIKEVDWQMIKNRLNEKFGDIADQVLLISKPQYYEASNSWKLYCQSVDSYIEYTQDLDIYQLNNYASILLSNTSDPKLIRYGLRWSEKVISKANLTKDPQFLDTYSLLLYRAGKKKLAISALERYLKLIAYQDAKAQKRLEEMIASLKQL